MLWKNQLDVKVLNPEQSLLLSMSKDKLDALTPQVGDLATIDYFKRFYKPQLKPESSSPGMMGSAVKNSDGEKENEDQSIKDYGFNELSSSKVSLERSIPDNRDTL